MSNTAIESVWDYPRPPLLEPTVRRIRIVHQGTLLADTTHALRVLETSHPPVYYLPPEDLAMQHLRPSRHRQSFCEFKGMASYWDLELDGSCIEAVAWSYPAPAPRFAGLRDHLAFYAGKLDECSVDGEMVQPQPGDFYGGWITSHVSGPFKGAPGTLGW